MSKKSKLRDIAIGLVLICVTASAAAAQGTAFSYQGKLTEAGSPANGNYDLEFALFDTLAGGVQQGQTLTRNPVTASAGLFTVTLDFGANVFSGAARYLEIGVRPASSSNPYTVLAPRQPIASTPYAIQTLNAEKLGGMPASAFVQNSGTGTVNSIPVWSTGTTLGNSQITQSANGVQLPNNVQLGVGAQGNQVQFGSPNSETGMTIQGAGGMAQLRFDGTLKLVNGPGSGVPPATNGIAITTAGNVGIGTTNPLAKLNVLSNDSAIFGQSAIGTGVYGQSGVVNSVANAGVYGRATNSGGIGVIGESNINNAVGVYGVSGSPTGFGMYARNNFGGRALFVEGNAGQSLSSNGLVKAMISAYAQGVIANCYNGITNSSSGNCGFIITEPLGSGAGVFRINFGFPVSNRFVSITCEYKGLIGLPHNAGANYRFFDSTSIEVFTFAVDNADDTLGSAFTIIMY